LRSAWGRCSTTHIRDVGKDTAEQVSGHGHLGHLEDGVAGMGDELRADLHELVADTGQRPVLHLLRKREGAQEVGKVVGKRMKLEPYSVAAHGATRQPGPFDHVLALLDGLLRRAALVVEHHDPVGTAG